MLGGKSMAQPKKKYYAIKEGKGVKNIILDSWSKCQPLVIGYNAKYKSFKTEDEAKEYLNLIPKKQVKKVNKAASKAKQKKKEKGGATVSVQAKIPKELYEKFLKRCEIMDMDKTKTLQSLIQETFEEWTDDIK